MAATKKVILFIVEGPTEETALGSVLERCFDSDRVRFDVIHGDITSALSGDKNPRERVRTAVLDEIERDRGYRNPKLPALSMGLILYLLAMWIIYAGETRKKLQQ